MKIRISLIVEQRVPLDFECRKTRAVRLATKKPLGHPGEILKEGIKDERGLSNYKVSKGTGINQTALGEIVKENDLDQLYTQYDLDCVKQIKGRSISKVIPLAQMMDSPSKKEDRIIVSIKKGLTAIKP